MANLKATNTVGGRRKGMFALRLKDNLEVRTLEELRDNFDFNLAGEPVDIQINGHFLAKGEVVVIDENFGVRIMEIATPAERAMNLR